MQTLAKDLLSQQLPTRKNEDWKYADLSFLQKQDFAPFVLEKDNECEFIAAEKRLVVKINNTSAAGKLKQGASLPKGFQLITKTPDKLTIQPVSEFSSYKNYFLDLATALNNKHLCLVIGKDFPADILIELRLGAELPGSSMARLYDLQLAVLIEAGASATILEKLYLKTNYFHLSGVDYFLQENAQLKVLKSEVGSAHGRGGHTSRVNVAAGAEARITTLTMSSDWSRHNIFAELDGANAFIGLEAAYLAKDAQFIDHHTVIEHRVPNTTSSQKYNGVLADKSKGVFNGKVVIARDAQKSSAVQLNRNLLLSKQAEINTKPELRIDADDVQAKHGATVGQLNEDQLFYLLSRGITEKVARSMLTRGFVEEIGLNLPEVLRQQFFADIAGFVHDRMEQ
jgi:Fe-S cluster assembly protein SufD